LSDYDENIRTLINLGLTGAQAKIFVSLLRMGQATIKEVAKVSKVARPDTYRALSELQEIGIVEKIISMPIKFNSLSIKDSVEILISKRNNETLELNKKANKLIEKFEKINTEPQREDDKLVLIPEDALDLELRKHLEKSEDSVYIIVSSQRMFGWVSENFECIEEALKRKVAIHVVTEKFLKPNLSKEIAALAQNPNFEIRHIVVLPTAWLALYDHEILVLTTSLNSAVISSNKILIELAKDYFDAAWFSSIEPIDQIFKKDARQFDYLFANMINGFAYCQMVFDKEGRPSDFIFLQVNDAFSKITGFEKNNVIGKKVSQAIPGIKEANPDLFESYGRVSLSGKSEEVETFLKPLNIWVHISIYSPKKGYFATLFEDISEFKKTQQELIQSESKYRNIFNNSAAGIFRSKLNGSEILDCNSKFLAIFGRTKNEVIGKPATIHWADSSKRQEMVRSLLVKGHIDDFECKMLTKDGEVKTCLASLNLDLEKKILEGSIIDISDRKRVENDLKESQYFIKKILDTTPTLIYIYDLIEHSNVYANQEIVEILGYTAEEIEMMGPKLFSHILHPDDVESVAKHHLRLSKAAENEQFEIEYRMKHSDGGWRWLHSIDIPFNFNHDGTIKQILGSSEEITERKNNEMELRRLNELLERIGNSLDAGLAIIGKDYRVIWANKTLKDLWINSFQKCHQIFHKSDSICPNCGVKKIFEQNLSCDVHEFETINSKGEKMWIELRVTPLKDKNGATLAALELAIPITERKKAEQELLNQKNKAERYLNIVKHIVLALDVSGKITLLNKKGYQILGYEVGELEGKDWVKTCVPASIKEELRMLQKSLVQKTEGGFEYFENLVLTKNGEQRLIKWYNTLLTDESGKVLGSLSSGEDITQNKIAEESIKNSEKKFRCLFENYLDGMIIAKRDGKILAANPAVCEMLGMTEKEVLAAGRQGIVVDDNRNISALKAQDETGRVFAQISFIRKDNSIFDAEISSRNFTDIDGTTSIFLTVRNIGKSNP
jgi:PAS domain S-box-containing protein